MKRRDFLKAGILGASAASASRIEGVTQTIFDNKKVFGANSFGTFWLNLNSSQIVSVSEFEGDKFPNTMNYSLPDNIQNENRVLYPMVRKSYLKAKGAAKSELRGKEEFVRVSWDVALDLAAKALKENFDKYGDRQKRQKRRILGHRSCGNQSNFIHSAYARRLYRHARA